VLRTHYIYRMQEQNKWTKLVEVAIGRCELEGYSSFGQKLANQRLKPGLQLGAAPLPFSK